MSLSSTIYLKWPNDNFENDYMYIKYYIYIYIYADGHGANVIYIYDTNFHYTNTISNTIVIVELE